MQYPNYWKKLLQVKELILTDIEMNAMMAAPEKKKNKYKVMLYDIVDNSKQLFMPPILRFTFISIAINLTFHIGYYGLMMWFPELFTRFSKYDEKYPGQETDICKVTEFYVRGSLNSTERLLYPEKCDPDISSEVFQESLITVASAIPANIVAVLFMDRLGRKFFLGNRSFRMFTFLWKWHVWPLSYLRMIEQFTLVN